MYRTHSVSGYQLEATYDIVRYTLYGNLMQTMHITIITFTLIIYIYIYMTRYGTEKEKRCYNVHNLYIIHSIYTYLQIKIL